MRIKGNLRMPLLACLILFILFFQTTYAQVNMVEYGKNRVQHNRFQWSYYQSPNFNVHYYQNGLELAKFVTQSAEEELSSLEDFIEFSVQRRMNVVLYNHYNDYKQSNIGIGLDWPNSGGITKLVNNKMVLYFNGDHLDLRRQIREGIAKVLVETLLFGDDLGEFAQNQALLDLPKWMTDGYISYAAEIWNTKNDNLLKSAMLGYSYKNFYQFAFEQSALAGHAFWYYIEEKYGRENVTYLLYLSRMYKNVNRATQTICKKKLKTVLKEFISYNQDKYYKDIRSRRDVTRGRVAAPVEIKKKDYFRFQASPQAKSSTFAVVEYHRGVSRIVLNENFIARKVIWRSGVRNLEEKPNPNYPLMAWDPKGTRLSIITWEKGKLLLRVYDVPGRKMIINGQILPFEQINDMQHMLDAQTLLLSAVKGGQSDIYIYKIEKQLTEQITVYDDLDASFVAFPNKTGILFSSNRPASQAPSGDTVLPKNRYNVFLVDNWNKSEFKQITQLSNIKYGNARYPMQYNVNHFTFVSDETGIGNRWAGFFTTQAAGVDTIYQIGEEILRNPEIKEIDSTLKSWNRTEPDSVYTFRITQDSAYTFPITNYQSSILETRIAGDKGMVTEVNRQGQFKFLYKLNVDEKVLRKRNINARPTEYIKRITRLEKTAGADKEQRTDLTDSISNEEIQEPIFETGFEEDSTNISAQPISSETSKRQEIYSRMRPFLYTRKYFVDNVTTNFLSNNVLLINRFQPYSGASGPVQLGNNNSLNAMTRIGTMEFLEDYKFSGGFRINYGFEDKEVFMRFDNLRRRLDWGATYYRMTQSIGLISGGGAFQAKQLTNLYQGTVSYPFNEVQSIRVNAGIRRDEYIVKNDDLIPGSLTEPSRFENFIMARAEFVHDNSIAPAANIWKGLRMKGWFELFSRAGGNFKGSGRDTSGTFTFNVGFDVRHYLQIYRNIIWAVRGASDFSWGNNKLIYYLGGTDGWLMLGNNQVVRNGVQKERYFNTTNRPAPDQSYVYESLAVNLRGFTQNVANGNNAMVINSEIRVPVFTTFFNKPINNAFLRNFQLVQFVDLGAAWNGRFNKFGRPEVTYNEPGSPLTVVVKAPGIGPFIGSYGFGARSTLLGYFIRFDAGWPMSGFFNQQPKFHVSLGFDF
ncbi:MAG: hypothetical protein ACK50E_02985 [Bacteroidota bacterium]